MSPLKVAPANDVPPLKVAPLNTASPLKVALSNQTSWLKVVPTNPASPLKVDSLNKLGSHGRLPRLYVQRSAAMWPWYCREMRARSPNSCVLV